jgi:hypothetical protein
MLSFIDTKPISAKALISVDEPLLLASDLINISALRVYNDGIRNKYANANPTQTTTDNISQGQRCNVVKIISLMLT